MRSQLALLLFFLSSSLFVHNAQGQQEESGFEPNYVTVTTLRGISDFDMDSWLRLEQEYFDKVTSKIDLILGHEVLFSYFEPNYTEILLISVLRSWDDIMAVNDMREDLIAAAWPDEEERRIFFERQNSYYNSQHSDEIYLSAELAKEWTRDDRREQPYVFLMDTSILSDYVNYDAYDNYKQYVEQVIHQDPNLLGYLPYRHFWGADSREFVEVYIFNSPEAMIKHKASKQQLLQEMIPEESDRKLFMNSIYSAIESKRSAIYTNVPSLSK